MTTAHNHEELSGHELPDGPANSFDAMIVVAQKKTLAGSWQIGLGKDRAKGNSAELTVSALVPSDRRDPLGHEYAKQTVETHEQKQEAVANDKLRVALAEAVALLRPAQQEIERLRAQLVEATQANRKASVELMAAEMRLMEIEAKLSRAVTDGGARDRQTLREEILKQAERRELRWWRRSR